MDIQTSLSSNLRCVNCENKNAIQNIQYNVSQLPVSGCFPKLFIEHLYILGLFFFFFFNKRSEIDVSVNPCFVLATSGPVIAFNELFQHIKWLSPKT